MKFLFVMDPIQTVKPYKDTSYFLMLAASQRGHEVFHAETSDLFFLDTASVHATSYKIKSYKDGDTFTDVFLNARPQSAALDDFDVIWIRKDPPFDDSYLYMTRLLSFCKRAKVINSPQGLQAWNEKLAALEFLSFCPWTLVSQNAKQIASELKAKGGKFVLKPLDGFGGKGIEFILSTDGDLETQINDYIYRQESKAIIVQEYLEAAKEGDKRILLWNGKAIGAVLRLHAEGKELNNIDAGGRALATTITSTEQKICDVLGPRFKEMGLLFVGIDLIGEKLTEINITSPTTLQEMSRLNQLDLHISIIKDLE